MPRKIDAITESLRSESQEEEITEIVGKLFITGVRLVISCHCVEFKARKIIESLEEHIYGSLD